VTVDLGRIDWVALGAIATVLLAGATVALGWQTHRVAAETRDLAKTTAEEIDLSRQQAKAASEQAAASADQAKIARDQFEASQRQRREDARPYLRWEMTSYHWDGADVEAMYVEVNLAVTNHGAIAVISNLEINATASVLSDPLSIPSRLLPTGHTESIHVRFGPHRRLRDFAFTGTASLDAKSPNWGEIMGSKVSFRCRIFDGGQLQCDIEPVLV
jgi:hypothetical protein